jgi:hypothetical protein
MIQRNRILVGSIISAAAVATFLAVGLTAATAHAGLRRPAPPAAGAPGSPDSNTFIVGYFDVSEPGSENGTGSGDNIVHLVNPTSTDPMCAMIYVYDDDQELGECCGCPLSNNKLLSLSVRNQLTSNWELRTPDIDNGLVAIQSGTPNNPGCINLNPESPDFGKHNPACNGGCDPTLTFQPAPGLVGSILKPQKVSAITSITETNMFKEGAADDTEIAFASLFCFTDIANGSGNGACNCGPEVDGAIQ